MILPCSHDSDKIPFPAGSSWVKGQCGRCWNWHNNPAAREMYERGPNYQAPPSLTSPPPTTALGDHVHAALAKAGISQGVKLITEWLGVECHCSERQEKLNQLDRWARRVVGGKLTRAREYLQNLTGMKLGEALPAILPPPGKKESEPKMITNWAYGVTTVQSRRGTTLPITLASLRSAGFDSPRLFVDGVKDIESWEREFGLETTVRSQRILPYGNWILALWEIYIRNPVCDLYAIFQDDFITYPNLRQYLNSCLPLYPGKASYWNLSTHPLNEKYLQIAKPGGEAEKYVGWYESNQRGLGAVALVFSREFVWGLLSHKLTSLKPASPDRSFKWIDGAVVETCHQLGGKEYVHMPALVQHIGKVSAIAAETPRLVKAHGIHADSTSFRGERFNALDLLGEKTHV